jgi:hypothetical protein
MSLCTREQRQLRDIEAGLFRSDSHLAGMLETYGRLYRSPDMPASEQMSPGRGRDRRAVAALALSIPFSAALTLPARYGAPVSAHRPPSPSAPGPTAKAHGQQNLAGQDRQPPHRRPRRLKGVSDAGHSPPGGIGARLGAGASRPR